MTFKPMLAGKFDLMKASFPYYGSVKLDGIRCLIREGKPVSRTLKDIPNDFIRGILSHHALEGFDGELIVGEANDKNVYQITSSGVMSRDGCPEFTFWAFDLFGDDYEDLPFAQRFENLKYRIEQLPVELRRTIVITSQNIIEDNQDLLEIEQQILAHGYEGVMLRKPEGKYKQGRATAKSGELLKLKRFSDKEALVVGVEELMSNQNEATKDNLGHTKRSANAEGLVPMDTMGALICVSPEGQEFKIGTGFTADQRKQYWVAYWVGQLQGRYAKYKSFDVGVKDAPRFPVFLGFRHPIDMDPVVLTPQSS